MIDDYNRLQELIQAIQRELDAKPWSPETLEAIASLLRDAGFDVRDVN
jgi:hypothetical protein